MLDQLLNLAMKRELTDEDRIAVANLYEQVCELEPEAHQYREDCLTVIKYRLWRM